LRGIGLGGKGAGSPLWRPLITNSPCTGHIPDELAQKILVAGRGPRVIVFVIESLALQQNLLRFGIQMLGGDLRRQSREQAAAARDAFKGLEGIFQVQLQTEIGRQHEPPRHLFLFTVRGQLLGQGIQNLFFEAQFKAFLLVGLADNLDLIELPAAEGFQNRLRMIFDEA
jgi:hypothetical protein